MALIIVSTPRFIEVSLDGATDFDSTTDLASLGLARNAPSGLMVKKITFYPSAANDEVIVRDGENGPRVFGAEVLGTYDLLSDPYKGDSPEKGKIMKPFIHATEVVVDAANNAYVVFEL